MDQTVRATRELWDRLEQAWRDNDEPRVHELTRLLMEMRRQRLKDGTVHQLHQERVLDELAAFRMVKIGEYGESRYEETDAAFNQTMCFSDVHRKYIRARTQALSLEPGALETLAALRETYLDLAAYAVMAVQLIDADAQRLHGDKGGE